jgi:hypothetical protein
MHAVLSELAAIFLRLDRGLRRRPKALRDRLGKMIAPLMQTLLPLVHSKSNIEKHVSLEGFHELHFASLPTIQSANNGSGGGNHTHLKKFMRLLSVL